MNRNKYSEGKSEFETLAKHIKKYKVSADGAIPFEKVQLSTNNINDMLDFFSKVFKDE